MKQFLKILKVIPAILARIAHVFDHLTCDEVPPIDLSHVDYGYIDPSGLDSPSSEVDDDYDDDEEEVL